MKKRLAILLIAVLFVGSQLQAQDTDKPALRTWKDSTGQFSIRATFVRVSGDNVVLQDIDKKELSLPLAKLSAADQQYVKARLTSDSSASKTITNTIGMKLNLIPAGTFMMGSPADETGRQEKDIEHQHPVTISKAFYMQTTEVTQGQWEALMGSKPYRFQLLIRDFVKEGANYPATYVNWGDAVAYCKKMSEKEGKTYRLPTEAEWEYACRAGTETKWSFGHDDKALGDHAWYIKNTFAIGEKYAHQVGLKNPNAFGLYDMHGNVYEWCHDYYGANYYQQSPEKDPTGPRAGLGRVVRGGSMGGGPRDSRSANRSWLAESVSFRWKRTPSSTDPQGSHHGFRLVRELD